MAAKAVKCVHICIDVSYTTFLSVENAVHLKGLPFISYEQILRQLGPIRFVVISI